MPKGGRTQDPAHDEALRALVAVVEKVRGSRAGRSASACGAPYHLCQLPCRHCHHPVLSRPHNLPQERRSTRYALQPMRRARSGVIARQLAPATVCVKDAADAFEVLTLARATRASSSLAREKTAFYSFPKIALRRHHV